jgi:phosphatidate cytidylyltransferase
MKTFLTRAISALVFLIIMLGSIWWGIYSYVFVFTLISAGCLWEYFQLMGQILPNAGTNKWQAYILMAVSTGIMLLSFAMGNAALGYALMVVPFLLILVFLLEVMSLQYNIINALGAIGGLIYILMPCLLIVSFAVSSLDDITFAGVRVVTLAILLLIWTNDTMAYIIGALLGRTPFIPHISPKKTWEGIAGGMASTVLMAWLLHLAADYIHLNLPYWWAVGLGVSFLSILGDLVESMIKRQAGVKDSGHIMPGHGGFLDRFDAMLFALPMAMAFVIIINRVSP